MHVEKNICENVVQTIFGIKDTIVATRPKGGGNKTSFMVISKPTCS
jgi:hypothetical protein